jgi:tRNA threonylcarbamoyladenosine biosynthesis protein TsaE
VVAHITRSVEETQALGERLGAQLQSCDFVALEGPLGAGKTRLVEGIARGLGVPVATRIPSPTFTLVNEHAGRYALVHADFYRLRPDELDGLGWRDYLARDAVIVVEWLSRIPNAAPADRVEVAIAPAAEGGDERRITLSATGPRAAAILAAMGL